MVGGVWGRPSVDGGGSFSAVSWPSTTACSAVGSFDVCGNASRCADPGTTAIAATERAGVWPDAPSPPRIARVTPLDRAIRVAWSAASSSHGPAVAGYVVTAVVRARGLLHEYLCATASTSCAIRARPPARSTPSRSIRGTPSGCRRARRRGPPRRCDEGTQRPRADDPRRRSASGSGRGPGEDRAHRAVSMEIEAPTAVGGPRRPASPRSLAQKSRSSRCLARRRRWRPSSRPCRW